MKRLARQRPREAPRADRDDARRSWRGIVVWLAAWVAMVLLDGHIDLGNQALILVLAASLAALWLPALWSMTFCAVAVMAFNVAFVPPRGQLTVDLEQHALLLVTMLVVSWLIALMVSRQRRLAAQEREHYLRADQLRRLGEALRDTEDPRASAALLQQALSALSGGPVALLMLAEPPSDRLNASEIPVVGEASDEERVALWLCLRQRTTTEGAPPGAHSWYIPLRGRTANYGAALLRLAAAAPEEEALREHVQALCDQMGLALERSAALRSAAAAREGEQAQALRNTMLAAIAHDHRTPLATILGAASSLQDQGERLSAEQRRRIASTIVDEATQLARLTDNTLQLARLDAPGLALHLDWESIEELVGTVVRRVRQRNAAHRIEVRIDPGLPLLRCDAVLLVQLLDNLIDNAFKHGGGGPVEVEAGARDGRVAIAVRDRGPGVPAAWRSRIFDAFQRAPAPATSEAARLGAGVGLAVCRAIALAHGGELVLRDRAGGGASFELLLPVAAQPGDHSDSTRETSA